MTATRALGPLTDDQLVNGIRAGDRDAIAMTYDRYADRLYDFSFAVLRDQDVAAGVVRDTFRTLVEQPSTLDAGAPLRPTLYRVARRTALKSTTSAGAAAHYPPGAAPGEDVQRELIWQAAADLPPRDRAILDLYVRQGLEGADLGIALGVGATRATVLTTWVWDRAEQWLGAVLVARQAPAGCPARGRLLAGWTGTFSTRLRKQLASHVDKCPECGELRRKAPSPLTMLSMVPPLRVPAHVRNQALGAAPYARLATSRSRGTLPVVLTMVAVVSMLLAGVGVGIWLERRAPDQLPAAAVDTPATQSGLPAPPAPEDTTGPAAPTRQRPTTPPANAPKITSQVAFPARINTPGCGGDRTLIFAEIDSAAAPRSVTLRAKGTDGKSTSVPMTRAGARWFAQLGPYPTAGSVTWQITVTDAAGTSATGPTATLAVVACR